MDFRRSVHLSAGGEDPRDETRHDRQRATLGDRARHGIHARTRPLRLDDGRRRLDDRVGHLSGVRRHGANDWQPWLDAGRVGARRRPDHRRRAVVRRARRDDAARRRPVRLHPRGVLAAVGISVRLDAVSGHPDRNDCRRRRRLRPVFRRASCRGLPTITI